MAAASGPAPGSAGDHDRGEGRPPRDGRRVPMAEVAVPRASFAALFYTLSETGTALPVGIGSSIAGKRAGNDPGYSVRRMSKRADAGRSGLAPARDRPPVPAPPL